MDQNPTPTPSHFLHHSLPRLFVILGSMVIIAIFGIIFYFNSKTTEIPQKQALPTPTSWKTYTNSKAGYSLQYPPEFSTNSIPNESIYLTDPNEHCSSVHNMAIYSYAQKLKPANLADWMAHWYSPNLHEIGDTKINATPAKEYQEGNNGKILAIEKGNYVIIMQFIEAPWCSYESPLVTKDNFDKILSTFKLTP